MVIELIFSSFVFLFLLRKISLRYGLVDKPNERKLHKGSVPLVGRLAIYFTLLTTFFCFYELKPLLVVYMSCMTVLMICGVVDDKCDISFKLQLCIQAGVACLSIYSGEKSLHQLGNLFGYGNIIFPEALSYLVTILAVMAAINAFNMVDGIDGLLGVLATVTFSGLGIMSYLHGNTFNTGLCALLIVTMLPYIMLNLGRRNKVFMGDAGSILLGFTVVWLLLSASQRDVDSMIIRPVTALWLIAIPLMDMTSIMIRRIRKGQSPFKPDREHLHHICQRLGLSPTASLLFISFCAVLMSAMGLLGDLLNVPEAIMLYSFLILFVVYLFTMMHIWKVVAFLKCTFGLQIEFKADA